VDCHCDRKPTLANSSAHAGELSVGEAGMAGKIFINYRREDDPAFAARVRDELAATFGKSNLFMDIDNLLAGQRFDKELAKALAECNVLIAVIGRHWMQSLRDKSRIGERDYVREEIAEALKREIVVVPTCVGPEGHMPAMPRPDDLPADIRDLVHYQKQDISHENFVRDVASLTSALKAHITPDPALAIRPGSGQSFRDTLANGQSFQMCPEMLVVPAGSFLMGSQPEEPDGKSRQVPFIVFHSPNHSLSDVMQ
jgi:TIR domain